MNGKLDSLAEISHPQEPLEANGSLPNSFPNFHLFILLGR